VDHRALSQRTVQERRREREGEEREEKRGAADGKARRERAAQGEGGFAKRQRNNKGPVSA